MLLKIFKFGSETAVLRSGAGKRSLAVIACVSILAGCNSLPDVPSFSEMGEGLSQTYSDMESGVRQKYNETFNSTDESSNYEAVSARGAVKAKEERVTLNRSAVRRLQGRLARLEFRPGPIDGILGLQTVKAIKRYQTAHRLPVTGRISSQFLSHLEETSASRNGAEMLTNSPN